MLGEGWGGTGTTVDTDKQLRRMERACRSLITEANHVSQGGKGQAKETV